ncbi:UNVERIFIED_CONTAM: hypothetical protein RKD43_000092 [Streptomyces graminofaciens]
MRAECRPVKATGMNICDLPVLPVRHIGDVIGLGVPQVHYLISVAEDVGAAYVRRGAP